MFTAWLILKSIVISHNFIANEGQQKYTPIVERLPMGDVLYAISQFYVHLALLHVHHRTALSGIITISFDQNRTGQWNVRAA